MWFSVVCTFIDNDMRHHSGQTTLNHIRFIFFFRARAEKGIAWNIDASSVVWNLIDNGKLANQITRLVAIMVTTALFCFVPNTLAQT